MLKTILPSNDKINKHLQNHNIIYLPKDIIGGDFYWFESTQEFIYFAVADCTGHGVPGGMVSLICVNALNKSFKEERLIETSDILNRSRQLIIETFNNNGQNVYDGMDIIICRWSKSTNQLSFSGANRPLWILRGQTGLIDEFKTDRFPVGKFFDEKPFSDFSTHLDKNDLLFMFSDGIVDQFGKEGKFKTSRLKNLILKNRDYHLSYQSQFIKDAFLEWKDSEEQTDDVCMWIINL
jgi:serine phosphatase RsbU (regulator of sigma subunit)